VGVLVDLERARVHVGAPALVRSTLLRLAYLDGAGSERFEKVAEHTSLGERVTVWGVRWPEADPAR
jgi:hypothetical protein